MIREVVKDNQLELTFLVYCFTLNSNTPEVSKSQLFRHSYRNHSHFDYYMQPTRAFLKQDISFSKFRLHLHL